MTTEPDAAVRELLRESEELRRRLIEGTEDTILMVGLEGRIASVENRGHLFDVEQGLAGMPWVQVWVPEARGDANRALEAARAGSIERFVAAAAPRGAAAPTYWKVSVSPLRDAAGSVEHLLVTARDVTAERHLKDARERLSRELEEALRVGETFLAIVGHDLRNPLNAILIGAQLLEQKVPDGVATKTVARLRSSSRRIERMLDELADLARATLGGGISIHREPGNLGALAARAVSQLRSGHPERVIELTSVGDLTGEWDGARIEQVVAGLLANALRGGEAGACARMHIDGTRAGTVQFGIGGGGSIPPDLLPPLFLPFRSGRQRTSGTEGLGLGLFFAKHLVEAHGGELCVESTDDSGARFVVTLARRGS